MPDKLTTRMAIFVNIRDDNGRLLLQQRANTGYRDGFYDFACSGHVDEGEGLLEAAVRELKEELGIVACEADLRLVHVNQTFVDRPYANFTFELREWEGEAEIKEPEKCSDLAFFSPDSLPEHCTLNVRVNQKHGFSSELHYSKVTPLNYQEYMGVPAAEHFNTLMAVQ
jgi:8-oxo-dGTP diphosphatase